MKQGDNILSLAEELAQETANVSSTVGDFEEPATTDFYNPVEDESESAEVPTPQPAKPQPAQTTPEPTEAEKRRTAEVSARTALSLYDTVATNSTVPILKWKYLKKLPKEQREQIEGVELKADADRTEEEKLLLLKYDKITSTLESKIAKLNMSSEKKEDLTEMLTEYFILTGKSISPAWLLGFALIDDLGNRVTTILLD